MKRFSLFLFIFLFMIAGSANATTYYLSTTGSNGAAGTSTGTAWATFAYAGAHMTAGDTLEVIAGTYVQRFDITAANGWPNGTNWTTGSGAITIRNYQGGTVWIRPSNGLGVFGISGRSYYIFDGIGVDGGAINNSSSSYAGLITVAYTAD